MSRLSFERARIWKISKRDGHWLQVVAECKCFDHSHILDFSLRPPRSPFECCNVSIDRAAEGEEVRSNQSSDASPLAISVVPRGIHVSY